ncbi:hypothetical protein QR680_016075 [Steinernema hermaphroditum]|uniref:7TM GPCR serpentine receptor class x (Srx) domain-containing protein n=1 Tax=Steinernema hermaphroditum TaxID=289476 RepID=A0AA39HC47_9BILA|nr:hypothetical protein QR680_016075 [Steinernema hermaphroditum]
MNGTAAYGDELRGRGHPTATDVIVGILTMMVGAFAIAIGATNLVIIKKFDIFHNAFGWFWASRTVGEMVFNSVNFFYCGPITIMQSSEIPIEFGFAVFIVGYYGGCAACAMHQFVSANRFVAVWFPLKYSFIFKWRTCLYIIIIVWVQVAVVMTPYFAIPCQMIGYSPKHYDFVFVKCDPEMERDFSYVGTVVNRVCFVICLGTVCLDFFTLGRIIYLSTVLKLGSSNDNFARDVRFFAQTSMQNMTMIVALVFIVIINNRVSFENVYIKAVGFLFFSITCLNNGLALILFNPEVRARLGLTMRNQHRVGQTGSAAFSGQITSQS